MDILTLILIPNLFSIHKIKITFNKRQWYELILPKTQYKNQLNMNKNGTKFRKQTKYLIKNMIISIKDIEA